MGTPSPPYPTRAHLYPGSHTQMRTGHRELSPGTALTFTPSQPGCPSSETSELDGLGNHTEDTPSACGPYSSDPNEPWAAGAKRNAHPNSLRGGADFNSPPLCTSWASLVAQLVKNLPAMQETWVQFLGQEDPLEKEMATHSRILAWRIPWTEEPGRFRVHGVARVRHDLATEQQPDLLFQHPDLKCLAFRIMRNKHQLLRNHPSLHYFLQQPKLQSLNHSKNVYFRIRDKGRLSLVQKDVLATILHPRQINNNQSPFKPLTKTYHSTSLNLPWFSR